MSPFSGQTILLIFAQFLISFLTVYNINTFEEKFFISIETHSGLQNTQEERPAGGSEWFLASHVMDTFHANFHVFTS